MMRQVSSSNESSDSGNDDGGASAQAQPIHTRSRVARFFEALRGEAYGVRLDAVKPDAIERALAVLRRVFGPGRYFEVQTKGLEQIPASPAMLVSNHSGGTSIPDAWGLAYVWFSHFGTERPLHVLAHDMVFALKWPGKSFEQLGILRASRTMGEHILDQRRDLLVMPGGDVETWRPWRDRYTLRWSGRKGYARLAIQKGVPIVPVACAGAHDTLMVLTDGRRLARRLGLPALARAEIFPVHLSLPWVLGIGPLPHLPLPVMLRYTFGPPIDPPKLEPGTEPTEAQVEALDRAVRQTMQELLDTMHEEEPPPTTRLKRAFKRLRPQRLRWWKRRTANNGDITVPST